jgi:hypothetical protein
VPTQINTPKSRRTSLPLENAAASEQPKVGVARRDWAAIPSNWSDTSITASVPSTAITGSVVVTVSNVSSNGLKFTVTSPVITAVYPNSGSPGTSIAISGTNFGTSQIEYCYIQRDNGNSDQLE